MPWEQTEKEIMERIQEPGLFDPNSFRSKDIGNGIRLILGKKKGSDTMEAQAIRFDKPKWTIDSAKKWLSDHPSIKNQACDKKKYQLVQDIIDKYKRWAKRNTSDFDKETLTVYDIDLESGIRAVIGRTLGDLNFAIKEYLFPTEWDENMIKKWVMTNENKIIIKIEKIGE